MHEANFALLGCQKGGRECKYPEVIPTSKSASSQKRREKPEVSREGSSSLEDVEEEDDYPDAASPPADNAPKLKSSTSLSHLREGPRRESWPSSSEHSRRGKSRKTGSSVDPSPSPHDPESSAPTSPAASLRRATSSYSLMNTSDWSHIPQDVAFYLNYHREMLTCHHYLLKLDNDDFFKTTLFDHAIKNEALLYAIAAFASFHYSVYYTTGAFQTFLEYYNKSLALLRVSLDQPHQTCPITKVLLQHVSYVVSRLGGI